MIKNILDEIAAEPGSNKKQEILAKYADNETLKQVIYLAKSNRIKFHIKQLPEYEYVGLPPSIGLPMALDLLSIIYKKGISGLKAKNHLVHILSNVLPDDAYVIERIIDKDLKIGMGTTNINKIFKGLIEKEAYMGAKPHSEKGVDKIFEGGKKGFSDVKMDGRYSNALVQDRDVLLVSRSGEVNSFGGAKFVREFIELENEFENTVYNGELTMKSVPERTVANGILNSLNDIFTKMGERSEAETEKHIQKFLKEHGDLFENIEDACDDIIYTVWDQVSVEEYHNKESATPRNIRLIMLEDVLEVYETERVRLIEYKVVNNKQEAMAHFQEALARGLEGTILKSFDGVWKDGKPAWQIKMKLDIHLDLRIVDFQYGKKGTKNEHVISTLLVESSDGLIETNPAGMSEKLMKYITEHQVELRGSIVEMKCCGLSQDKDGNYSTLHPSVVELRPDKTDCDSLQSAKEIEDSAKGLR